MQPARQPLPLRFWPFLAVTVILLFATGLTLWLTMQRTDGHLIYALDDAYIHMGMAKNAAQHGVWGIDASGFTSSSSSPAWTFLLAAVYRLTGVHEATPFLINLALAIALVFASFVLLRTICDRPLIVFAALLFATLALPLPALIFVGMEHVLQALGLVALVLLLAPEVLEQRPRLSRSLRAGLVVALCLVLPLIRLESMFVIAPLALLLLRRDRALAVAMALASAVPVAAYGVISRAHGWYFLPNSVVINSTILNPRSVEGGASLARAFAARLGGAQGYPPLAVGAAGVFTLVIAGRLGLPRPVVRLLQVFCGAALLHFSLAAVGAFYRYEAYLMLIGFLALAGAAAATLREGGPPAAWPVRALATLVLAGSLGVGIVRAAHAASRTDRACANIYQQQYQMGMFVRRYYDDATVVLNDIGAVSFLSNARIIDICGLASMEFAHLGTEGLLNQQTAGSLVQDLGGDIAIVYESPEIPDWWTEAGSWDIPENIVCWRKRVLVLSCAPERDTELCRNLEAYRDALPDEVDSRLSCR